MLRSLNEIGKCVPKDPRTLLKSNTGTKTNIFRLSHFYTIATVLLIAFDVFHLTKMFDATDKICVSEI